MSQSFNVFLLISSDNKLALSSIKSARKEAEDSLKKEFPEGCLIWEGYRVIEATLTVNL